MSQNQVTSSTSRVPHDYTIERMLFILSNNSENEDSHVSSTTPRIEPVYEIERIPQENVGEESAIYYRLSPTDLIFKSPRQDVNAPRVYSFECRSRFWINRDVFYTLFILHEKDYSSTLEIREYGNGRTVLQTSGSLSNVY